MKVWEEVEAPEEAELSKDLQEHVQRGVASAGLRGGNGSDSPSAHQDTERPES